MLASVLIASRNRFDKCLGCIRSVYACASSVHDFEVIVRFHESDKEARTRYKEIWLEFGKKVGIIWGEDYNGYDSLSIFYQELLDHAEGDWCWHLNDDMVVTGTDWNLKLREMPGECLVQPELHQLNGSVYREDARGPAPIHPRESLGDALRVRHSPAVDDIIYTELVYIKAWPVRFLHSVGIHHQWEGAEAHVT